MHSRTRTTTGPARDRPHERRSPASRMTAPVAAPVAAPALTAAQLGELAREIRSARARLQRSMLAARARRDAASRSRSVGCS